MQLPAGDDVDAVILPAGFGQTAGLRDLSLYEEAAAAGAFPFRLQRPVFFRIRTAGVR